MNNFGKLIRRRPLLLTTCCYNITAYREYRENLSPILRELRRRQLKYGTPPEEHRNTFPEWNYKAELFSFGKRLNENFEDHLLRKALTERSYVVKRAEEFEKVGIKSTADEEPEDNISAAIHGEEILENFILLYLRHVLPRFPEEGIQSIKEYLMSEDTLSHVCFHIGTSELIMCADFPVDKSTLKRVMQALISALHESSGLERTSLFIRDLILTQIAELDINTLWTIEDSIGALKTICQNEGVNEPEARIVGDAGVNTILALYRVGYFVDQKLIGLGPGENVQIAKEIAAQDALRRLFGTSTHQLNIPFNLVLDPKEKSLPNVSLNEWCETKIQARLKAENAHPVIS